MEQLLEQGIKTGNIWIILFTALLVYCLQDSRKRESNYQETIKENIEVIKNCSQNCKQTEEINKKVDKIDKNVEELKDFMLIKGGKRNV